MRDINDAGLELVKSFEGIPDGDPTTVKIDPYLDPIGIWTIGWGHAIRVGSDYLRGKENRRAAMDLYPGGITKEQAEQLLRGDLMDTCRDVESLAEVDLTDNQFGALVSFTFNLGRGSLAKSTLLKKLNAGDHDGAADEFHKWNKAGRKILKGLVARRPRKRSSF